jgi:beta-N-acetylhexosaminidase
VTLVRDAAGRLPLRLRPAARVAVVLPRPEDLTPADTSSYVTPPLAAAVRRHHGRVEEFLMPIDPPPGAVRTLRATLAAYDLVLVGTINATAYAGQAALVDALCRARVPVVAVSLRMPYDLDAYPAAPTYACAYSILGPAMDAVADALWGRIPFPGRLPVSLGGRRRRRGG